MKKSLLFKVVFVLCAAGVLFAWAGQAFDNDDSPAITGYLPATFLGSESFGSEPASAFYHKSAAHPIIQESYAFYFEMREKSPPQVLLSF